MRRRARHRLIGAAVLVLVGVIGFPLLFDTQPRPIAVDIPIEIPSRNMPSAGKSEPVAVAQATKPAAVTTAESLAPREEVLDSKKESASSPTAAAAAPKVKEAETSAVKPAEKSSEKAAEAVVAGKVADTTAAKTPEKAPAKVADKVAEKPSAKPAADKLPEKVAEKAPEKTPQKAEDKPADGSERIVVQVGAFAEVDRARDARLKLERAGLKTYTHVAETPQGRRIRVRMGPFNTRADAEKAAARAKALGLPAALLWL